MKNTDIVKGNADVLKAAGFSVYLAGKPDELETRKWHEDALLVTDYEDRRLADIFLEMPRIGYMSFMVRLKIVRILNSSTT